jgi:2,3-diketo-5-methylthiopentyl-1-phosphate enolase
VSAQDLLIVTYQLDVPESLTRSDVEAMAAGIANGQTIGTSNPAQVARLSEFAARVLSVSIEPEAPAEGKLRALVRVGFPAETVMSDLGAVLAVTFGKISMGGAIRLADLEFPPSLVDRYQGPRFGIEGIRQKTGAIDGRPLVMAIFKPCLGLPPSELAEMLATMARAGVHLVKDDEILADRHLDDARRRLEACLKALDTVQAETGHRPLYALNLTGPAHEILSRAQTLVAEGANAFLFNYLCYGLPLLGALRETVEIPLIAHPALAGAFYGSPSHGVAPGVLFGMLPRLAGADAVLFPSPYGKVCLPMADAQAVRHALTRPVNGLKTAFPVPSAGIQSAMVPQIWRDFGSEVIINAGTGIMDAPEGGFAGARAFLDQLLGALPTEALA